MGIKGDVNMKKSILSIALTAAVLLCGCGEKGSELPSDTTYNHGRYAIMETEKGYYTNFSSPEGHMLRYYERDTENQIFLCAKPECVHDGNENCAATYKNLKCINTLLYDGAIYTLAIEDGDVISYSLYKAALDGTSFTKVGDAFSVSNSAGEKYEIMDGIYFMIHKGYAYIPYHLTLGDGTFGFAGSGLAKMDIQTGKTEILFSGENYFSSYPHKAMGVGDNVYYFTSSYGCNDPNDGLYRYNIKTGKTDKISDYIYDGITMDEEHYYTCGVYDDGTYCISALDINAPSLESGWEELGGRINEELHKTEGGLFSYMPRLMLYEDKIIAVSKSDDFVLVMNKNGEVLGSGKYDFNEISGYSGELVKEFNISEDKLYVNTMPFNLPVDDYYQKIYSIPIADIGSGKSEWKFEYGVKAWWQIYNEMGWDINVSD